MFVVLVNYLEMVNILFIVQELQIKNMYVCQPGFHVMFSAFTALTCIAKGIKLMLTKKTYHWPSSASGKLRAEWTEKTTRKIEYRIWMTSQASDWNASFLPFKILDCNLNVRMIS